ncbi:GNAT family N-acetyltransferase [Phytomonospora endophytica]|uniref:GNAT superfamily N-acetyltransferase n=1 Tax=Phytomonospora endophytica TaxID=714109 RepID=A0A841FUC3_9ACTN|nr:GNAT family N-acetyltransferase [Phytomonospora endophytica]MBB6037338.1 GNAT superfamily N-acetyltransferase [Phytomonospora endophytica]GIG69918.1 N-acetyltransferase [Phytomonospora endophytica]
MAVVIRAGEDRDLVAVGALHSRTRRAAYRELMSAEALEAMSPRRQHAAWAERVPRERETHRMLVAEHETTLLGFGYVGGGEDGFGWLCALHVDPAAHGTGVARLLLARAVDTLTELGHERHALWVIDGNARAIAFYTKSGWYHDGTRRTSSVGPETTEQLRYRRA